MLCLTRRTDEAWVVEALRDVDAVLVDHAHCEAKAASNALSLAVRHPSDLEIVRALIALAREELEHFERVVALLAERGIALGPPPVDTYAQELRRLARSLPVDAAVSPLADRLLVGALIEARSCERFKLLAQAAAGDPRSAPYGAVWAELLAAEARHFRTFVDLAVRAAAGDATRIDARLQRLAELEGHLVAELARPKRPVSRAAIHG